MTRDELFAEVSGNFTQDDGSLPGVEVIFPDPGELGAGYKLLCEHSATGDAGAECWHALENRTEFARNFDNIATEVASGRINPFHFVLDDLTVEEKLLPDVGVFVDPDRLGLDWRMGPAWDADGVFGFFALLRRLIEAHPGSCLLPERDEGPPDATSFLVAWDRFRRRES